MLPEPLKVIRKVTSVFDALAIPYFIGGSVASSHLGMSRATMDIDFVADLKEKDVAGFVAAFSDEFYVDADLVQDAVQTHSSFNIIYLPLMVKVDIFIMEPSAWAKEEWARRRLQRLGSSREGVVVYLASPEDMIIQKLNWFRMGGGVSDHQWSDIQGIFKVQATELDYSYLQKWATELGLSALLEKALEEAGLPLPHTPDSSEF